MEAGRASRDTGQPRGRSGAGKRWTVVAVSGLCALAAAYLWPAALRAAPPAQAAPTDCGRTTLEVERRGEIIFRLPDQSGQRLSLVPGDTVTLRIKNPPPSGRADLTVTLPFGQGVTKEFPWSAVAPTGEFEIEIGPDDYGEYAELVRGAYTVEVATHAGDSLLCAVPFQVNVGAGISGPIGTAAAATSAAAAAGTVAAAGWMAGSTSRPGFRVKVRLERRRKRGWRRWVPVPSLKRTLIGSLMGSFTGIASTIALQQGGVESMTSFTLVRNVAAGAFGSVSLGIAWGSVLAFLRKPVDDRAGDEPGAPPAPPVPGRGAPPGGGPGGTGPDRPA